MAACATIATAAVLGLPFVWSDSAEPSRPAKIGVQPIAAPLSTPTAHPRPTYLTRTYRAPPELVRPGAGGSLRIPSLGINAPVDAVGLDGTAMAVPNDPGRIGWLSSTARVSDLAGASVLAGHVSDAHDRPGALNRLGGIRLGAAITWKGPDGRRVRFRVVRIKLFPRNRGLPAAMFSAAVPHELNLVTCAERVGTANGGFHYTANLVVTAVS